MRTARNSISAIVLLVSTAFATERVNAIEQPEFEVVDQVGEVEIRKYPSQLVARTLVAQPFREAGNEGFRRLAGYIFGGNVEDQRIAMTAPVTLEPDTVPSPDSQYWITFNMPGEYAREELPVPDDNRVNIAEVPERYLAVLKYRGNWSEARYREYESRLMLLVGETALWSEQGVPSWARYNPPFTPWFMRTNEVVIEVVPVEQAGE